MGAAARRSSSGGQRNAIQCMALSLVEIDAHHGRALRPSAARALLLPAQLAPQLARRQQRRHALAARRQLDGRGQRRAAALEDVDVDLRRSSSQSATCRRSRAGEVDCAAVSGRNTNSSASCCAAASCSRRSSPTRACGSQASTAATSAQRSACSQAQSRAAGCLAADPQQRLDRQAAAPPATGRRARAARRSAPPARRRPAPPAPAPAAAVARHAPRARTAAARSSRPTGQPPPGSCASSAAWPVAMTCASARPSSSPRQTLWRAEDEKESKEGRPMMDRITVFLYSILGPSGFSFCIPETIIRLP